jgi:hypothetical protein
MQHKLWLAGVLAILCSFALSVAWAAGPELALDDPLVQVSRQAGVESCAFPADAYNNLTVEGATARFTLAGGPAEAGSHRVAGGAIKRVSWQPGADGVDVLVEFTDAPEFYAVNAMPGTELRPGVPQVIAAFSFPVDTQHKSYPVMGTGAETAQGERDDKYGSYELPKFPLTKYSDARVTLNVHNTDFRDVLWLLSDIGQVSIILDPYWDDEPTGSTRLVGGGAQGDGGGGDNGGGDNGGGGGGYRPAGSFIPAAPREGTGNLSLNFVDVPFDTALELVLMSVGLVKVDIYPEA